MTEIAQLIGSLEDLIRTVFYAVGVILVIQSLRLAAQRSELGPQQGSWFRPVVCCLAGVLLLALPVTVDILSQTLFGNTLGHDPKSILEYDRALLGQLDSEPSRELVVLVILFIQFVGLIAIIRSLLLFNLVSTHGHRVVGSSITFLVAGTIAVNFPVFWGFLVDLLIPGMGPGQPI